MLATTRVVQKEPRERRTPILEHADQRSARKVLRDAVFRNPGESSPVESGLDHQVEFIEE